MTRFIWSFLFAASLGAAAAQYRPPYYFRYAQAASPGNDLVALGDVARDESEAACSGYNETCVGYDNDGNLKSKIVFPLQLTPGMDLYVKTNSTFEPLLPLSILPVPSFLKNGTDTATIDADAFQFVASSPSSDLEAAFARYRSIIFNRNGGSTSSSAGGASISASRLKARKLLQSSKLLHGSSSRPQLLKGMGAEAVPTFPAMTSLLVSVTNLSVPLQLEVDESYSLSIPADGGQATLQAATVYGAYRGLETFSQLVRWDFDLSSYRVDWLPIVIDDAPAFPYRGLLIDCSRHYQPVPFLIQALDAMASAKLNVLHLHLVDSQAWPVESKAYPNLWRASWTPQDRYTLEDLAFIVEEARLRGVNVLPEFDTPGHSQAVCVGYPEACPSSTCWTPLNPVGNVSFDLIQGVFSEWKEVFPFDYFHAGGDEVNETCWQTTPYIAQWMMQQGYTNADQVYEYAVERVDSILNTLGKNAIRWQEVWEHFGTALPKDTIIHMWLDHATLLNVTSNGFRAILSDSQNLYLDHLDTQWQSFYDDDPLQGIEKGSVQASFVMGNEACQWGETADGSDLLQTIWPRAAASAERGWSIGATNSSDPDVFRRLSNFRCLLLSRGVPAAPLNNAQAREAPPFPGSCVWQ